MILNEHKGDNSHSCTMFTGTSRTNTSTSTELAVKFENSQTMDSGSLLAVRTRVQVLICLVRECFFVRIPTLRTRVLLQYEYRVMQHRYSRQIAS